jgi:hypothetical protein
MLAVWATSAFAQPHPDIAPDGRARFQEGLEAAKEGRWEDARLAFTDAYRLTQRASALFNLASAQVKTSHLVEAADSYARYLDMAGVEEHASERSLAEKAIVSLMSRIPKVRFAITNQTAADRLQVDEREIAPGASLSIDPGKHRAVVLRDGTEIADARFELEESVEKEVAIDLPAPESKPPPLASAAPSRAVEASPLVDTARESEQEPARIAPLVIAGAGALVLITSGVLWMIQSGQKSSLDKDLTRDPSTGMITGVSRSSYLSRLDTINHERVASGILAVGGGVLAAGGALWFAW